jgi:hypothetical protein
LLRVFHTQQREAARIPGIAEEGADLAMVRALTETVGGRVWLESEVGKGTTMSVILPLAEAAPKPAAARVADKSAPEQSEPPERSPLEGSFDYAQEHACVRNHCGIRRLGRSGRLCGRPPPSRRPPGWS